MSKLAPLLSLAVPLLAVGTVSGTSVTDGVNTCLDPGAEDYRCSLLPGVLSLNLTRCGIADGDADDLTACLGMVDHDPIQEVWLGENDLTALHEDTFAGLPKLRHLYLDGNSLAALSSGLFNGLSELESLHLDFNSLSSLSEGIFTGLGSLEELDLEGNELESLHEDVFSDLGALRSLWLSDNSLEGLSDGTFDVKDSLQQLHLHTNKLSTLPSEVFVNLVALTFLDLSENPDLECLPLPGPNVGAQYLILPDDFVAGGTCACPPAGDAGACPFDCEAGTQGYACSGGPTPSPMSPTPAPTNAAPTTAALRLTRSPVSSVDAPSAAATVTPATTSPATTVDTGAAGLTPTPASGTTSPGMTPAPDTSLSISTPASGTPAAATPAPTTATRDVGAGTPAPTSDSTCNNGLPGYQVGDACCTPGCAQCGGPECSTSSLSKGLDNHDCCVNTIIANGVECGGDVVAPCISYDTLDSTFAPVPVTEDCLAKNLSCQEDTECRQCISLTTVEQQAGWTDCQDSYSFDATDACASSAVQYCCVAEVSSNDACLTNDLFVAYAECSMEEASEGVECPLACRDIVVSSTVEGSGAGRPASSNLVMGATFLAGFVTLAMVVG